MNVICLIPAFLKTTTIAILLFVKGIGVVSVFLKY